MHRQLSRGTTKGSKMHEKLVSFDRFMVLLFCKPAFDETPNRFRPARQTISNPVFIDLFEELPI